MSNHWLEEAKKRLENRPQEPADVFFDRMRAEGMIDDQGQVTGHLHRWAAHLAIVQADCGGNSPTIRHFKCMKLVFGMPGGPLIDVSRDNLINDIKQGRHVITATWDDRLKIWREGAKVHLSPSGAIRIDEKDEPTDELGRLPAIHGANGC
jgi:hypothetical protein